MTLGTLYSNGPLCPFNHRVQIAANELGAEISVAYNHDIPEAVREAKFSGKHAPYLLFILDEGDAIGDEVYRGIESCMSGGRMINKESVEFSRKEGLFGISLEERCRSLEEAGCRIGEPAQ